MHCGWKLKLILFTNFLYCGQDLIGNGASRIHCYSTKSIYDEIHASMH